MYEVVRVNRYDYQSQPTIDVQVNEQRRKIPVKWDLMAPHHGSNFQRTELLQTDDGNLHIVRTWSEVYLLTAQVLGVVSGFIASWIFLEGLFLILAQIGLVLVVIFIILFFSSSFRSFTFDFQAGTYARKRTIWLRSSKSPDDFGFLEEIYAIQVLRENIEDQNDGYDDDGYGYSNASYNSYELILVMRNGNRVLITDHCSQSSIMNCANAIAERLDIPVWDVP